MINVIYDLETNDPDDYFTLCFLCAHPGVTVRGVTITPGSAEQVGIVRHVLNMTGQKGVRVGVPDHKSFKIDKKMDKNQIVSAFHYKVIPRLMPSYQAENVNVVLNGILESYPDTVLLTGAAVTNIASFLKKYPNAKIAKWVGQGGFAGTNIVAPEDVLPKFAGKESQRTFNFCQDSNAALFMLNSDQIGVRYLVSKNICHNNPYNKDMHTKMEQFKDTHTGLKLIYDGMAKYFEGKPAGKLFHDPLAAATMINQSICEFKEVELYYEKGCFGSELKNGTNTFISVKFDKDKFFKTLSCQE
jgi:inosine-uridine nucleoside N-ribohydrolase